MAGEARLDPLMAAFRAAVEARAVSLPPIRFDAPQEKMRALTAAVAESQRRRHSATMMKARSRRPFKAPVPPNHPRRTEDTP